MTERRQGHSKLVWDKASQSMKTVDPHPRDSSLDHRSLEWAVDIIGMCEPIRCNQGGMWFGRNHNMADATFVDYGAADAFAVAAKALPDLVKAIKDVGEVLEKDSLSRPERIQDALQIIGRVLHAAGQESRST